MSQILLLMARDRTKEIHGSQSADLASITFLVLIVIINVEYE